MKVRARAALALLIGVVGISWSAIFVRWTHMPGVASAFYRVLLAGVALWLIAFLHRSGLRGAGLRGVGLRGVSGRTFLLACLGGLFFAGDIGFYNVAVLRTAAGSATFLGNNAPLAVGLFAWCFGKKKPSRRFWIALLAASTGALLIVGKDLQHTASHTASHGDSLAIAASLCFALYLLMTERLRGSMDTMVLVALSSSASAAGLLVFALLSGTSLTIPSLSAGGALIGLGLVCQVIGYSCLTYALGHLPATVSSVVMLGVAPLTALLAFLLFGERMTPLQGLGGGLILAAAWFVSSRAMHGRST